ncbi:MAG: 30S ribosomal protein S20 [Phycisphaerae bacterium]|nr:30S ribosomal protein S20 [Phycisphaerae bacterium]
MAHSLSSKKRIRQNEKRRFSNRVRRSQIKTQRRRFREAVTSGDLDAATTELKKTVKLVDRVSAKGALHKNAAARIKARMQLRLNELAAAKS